MKGIKDSLSSRPKLKVRKMKGLLWRGGIAQVVQLCPITTDPSTPEVIPTEVQQIIDSSDSLFKEPNVLPPSRDFDHKIPLLPGVKPINVKP